MLGLVDVHEVVCGIRRRLGVDDMTEGAMGCGVGEGSDSRGEGCGGKGVHCCAQTRDCSFMFYVRHLPELPARCMEISFYHSKKFL